MKSLSNQQLQTNKEESTLKVKLDKDLHDLIKLYAKKTEMDQRTIVQLILEGFFFDRQTASTIKKFIEIEERKDSSDIQTGTDQPN